MRMVFDNHLFAQYPLTIYPKFINLVLTWLIPYAFASFVPATYLLGRDTSVVAWLGPLVAAGLLFIGYQFWRLGLRHYAGTGS
jgi:ABC-2 type transport system permease protein